jgi:hypothetical protein
MASNVFPSYNYGSRKATHFRQARRLLLNTSQAAGSLWEFRWGASTGALCLVNRVSLKGLQNANATAEELRFNLKVARSFTAVNSTNTASILRSGDMQKLNGDFADSLLTAFVETNSATAAAGGTMTLDTDSIAQGSFVSIATASTTESGGGYSMVFNYNPIASEEQALRLEQNEGWVISLEATKGATQGVVLILETSWTEIAP